MLKFAYSIKVPQMAPFVNNFINHSVFLKGLGERWSRSPVHLRLRAKKGLRSIMSDFQSTQSVDLDKEAASVVETTLGLSPKQTPRRRFNNVLDIALLKEIIVLGAHIPPFGNKLNVLRRSPRNCIKAMRFHGGQSSSIASIDTGLF